MQGVSLYRVSLTLLSIFFSYVAFECYTHTTFASSITLYQNNLVTTIVVTKLFLPVFLVKKSSHRILKDLDP
ncbi:MAG: hypothetical protein S4CHLAM27_11000 [Chlamydiia bacterium]|nr:hypothetical protein [Chlamydiia bacterium]